MKVLDFKARAAEKLQRFLADARTLPRLLYARYGGVRTGLIQADKLIGSKRGKRALYYSGSRTPAVNRMHQIHTQHRESLVRVLGHLIKTLDILSLSCRFVNPKHGINRALYVDEIARHTGLCRRTVQRCIGSLVRSNYIVRNIHTRGIALTQHFFRDLTMDISLARITGQLRGLRDRNNKRREAAEETSQAERSKPTHPSQTSTAPAAAPALPDGTSLAIGNQALEQLRKRLQGKGPPPS